MTTTSSQLSLGWALIDWIENYLVHGPGDVQGERVELDDEYAAFIVRAYRVDPMSGARIVRRAFLSRPKGRAKSELAGMLDCVEGLAPCRFDHWATQGETSPWGYEYDSGEPVGRPLTYVEILNVATEEGQAGNTFDNAYYMLNPETCTPELLEDYGRIDVGLTRINLPSGRGSIEPVTAANESKDGGKSTFIVADETHLWVPPISGKHRLGLMHQTMARNLLKRKIASGWMLETSTMYAAGENSVAEGTHAYAKSKAGAGGKLLFDHKQAADGHDLTKRVERVAALKEAYGPAAAWMDLDALADSYDDPQVDKREWERFWTNRPVPLIAPSPSIIPTQCWANCYAEDSGIITEPQFALDIDPDRKWAAFAASGRNPEGRLHVEVTGRPEENATDHRQGTVWVIPRLRQLVDSFPGMKLSIAAGSGAKTLIPDIEALGIEVESVGSGDVAAACGLFYDLATSSPPGMAHIGQETLTTALFSAKKRQEDGENAWIWGRKRSSGDITPLYAATLALWAAYQDQTADYDVLESVY